MSRVSKPLNLARLNDLILGCFAYIPPSETVDHLVRYLGTWSGSELRVCLYLAVYPRCTEAVQL